jgi:uncharacterized cysteine cluster protein YcgN (CxxCxxCC family)
MKNILRPFWKSKKLSEMTVAEWESLCDGCGICCLYKIEDEDSSEVFLTNVACRFLDLQNCVCTLYSERRTAMPSCIKLTPSKVEKLKWLPKTCAYRLVMEGKPLPKWHPLMSGDPQSVHLAGISVKGKVITESDADMNHLEDYVVDKLKKLDQQ